MQATGQHTNLGNETALLDSSQEMLDPRNYSQQDIDFEQTRGYDSLKKINDYDLTLSNQ